MKTLIIISITICSTILARSQENISYQIVELSSRKPIPYVTIKVKHTNSGFHADENGFFGFSPLKKDTLLMTAVGHTSKEVCLFGQSNNHIYLQQETVNLKEITIKPLHSSIIGTVTQKNSYRLTASVNFEFAVLQKLPDGVAESFIEKIFIKAANLENQCPVKLHIYSSENGKPSKELLNNNIFINEFIKAKKTVEMDMKGLNIAVTGSYFVGLEWVNSSKDCNGFNGSLVWATNEISESLTYKRTFLDPDYKWNKIDKNSIESTISNKTGNPFNLQVSSKIAYE